MKNSSTVRDRAFFHNLAYISAGSDWILMKFLSQTLLYPWTRKSPLNFGDNPDPESPCGHRLGIFLGGGMRSMTAVVLMNSSEMKREH